MATTQAILRGKDTTAQGELYSSFELGDKQWKITASDGKRAWRACCMWCRTSASRTDRSLSKHRLGLSTLPDLGSGWTPHGTGTSLGCHEHVPP